MRHIAAIPRLRKLRAQESAATDDGFVELSRSQTLEDIWGRECPNLTGPGFAASIIEDDITYRVGDWATVCRPKDYTTKINAPVPAGRPELPDRDRKDSKDFPWICRIEGVKLRGDTSSPRC